MALHGVSAGFISAVLANRSCLDRAPSPVTKPARVPGPGRPGYRHRAATVTVREVNVPKPRRARHRVHRRRKVVIEGGVDDMRRFAPPPDRHGLILRHQSKTPFRVVARAGLSAARCLWEADQRAGRRHWPIDRRPGRSPDPLPLQADDGRGRPVRTCDRSGMLAFPPLDGTAGLRSVA